MCSVVVWYGRAQQRASRLSRLDGESMRRLIACTKARRPWQHFEDHSPVGADDHRFTTNEKLHRTRVTSSFAAAAGTRDTGNRNDEKTKRNAMAKKTIGLCSVLCYH